MKTLSGILNGLLWCEVVRVDLPRSRELAMKRTPEFVRYVDRIWRLIED